MRWIAMTAAAALLALPALANQTPRTTPLDLGPWTPEANAAHRGGGVILEGLPGEPAPAPRPTAAEGPTAPLVVRDAPALAPPVAN